MHYDFSAVGAVMSFNMKIAKHVGSGNCNRVKDYICSAYDTFNPSRGTYKNHPCFEMISKGVDFLKARGWKVAVAPWKEIGEQVIVMSPEGDYYHSKFDHVGNKQPVTTTAQVTGVKTGKAEAVVTKEKEVDNIITGKTIMRSAFRNFMHR